MSAMSADPSLSRLELVVLARMMVPKPPTASALATSLKNLAFPTESAGDAAQVLANLTARGLLDRGRALTFVGHKALQSGLGVATSPSWRQARDKILPRLAGASSLAQVLGAQLGVPGGETPAEVADALISDELGLPRRRYTLSQLRIHVLAKRGGVEGAPSLDDVAKNIVVSRVKAPANKRSLSQAFVRRWLGDPPPAHPAPRAAPAAIRDLLTAVREAIHRIPSDGRHGREKVFVSALWQNLQQGDLTLDKFKRWLLAASRDGQVTLARADAPATMDPNLVAASEIRDQGATFHFVLDTQRANGRSAHAR